MFAMELEAARRREVLRETMNAGRRTAALDRSEGRRWHRPEVVRRWGRRADAGVGSRFGEQRPDPERRPDEVLATTTALRG